MKHFIILFVFAFSFNSSKAGIYGFNAKPLIISNDSIVTELNASFPFGSGTCKILKEANYYVSSDTLFCNTFYDKSGAWSAFGCVSTDTTKYYSLPVNIAYFKLIQNVYSANPGTGISDTSWNENDTTILLNPTSIHNYKVSELQISPNPFVNNISIKTQNGARINSVKIISLTGKMVFKYNNLNTGNALIDLSMITKGIYFLQIEMDKDIEQIKIEKE